MFTLIVVTLLAYCSATIFLLLQFLGRKEVFFTLTRYFSIMAFGLLSILAIKMALPVYSGEYGPGRNFYLFTFAWLFSFILGVIAFRIKKELLFALASPFLFVVLHIAMLTERSVKAEYVPLEGMLFFVHLFCVFIALILLFLGGLAAILFLLQDSVMKQKNKKLHLIKRFPSLEKLDKFNYATVIIGFPFYTLGLVSGFVWAGAAWGLVFSGDIKEIVSLAIWFLYGTLFHMRVGLMYRGKRPAYITIAVFLLSIFSLLGVNTLFETHHKF